MRRIVRRRCSAGPGPAGTDDGGQIFGAIKLASISTIVADTAVTNVPQHTSTATTGQVQCFKSDRNIALRMVQADRHHQRSVRPEQRVFRPAQPDGALCIFAMQGTASSWAMMSINILDALMPGAPGRRRRFLSTWLSRDAYAT
jgi:hypothetical protein